MTRFFTQLLFICCFIQTHQAFAQTSIIRVGRDTPSWDSFLGNLAPFDHGVASGDPTETSFIIWTRITPDNNQTTISGNYYIATDTAFTNVVKTDTFTTNVDRDYTVKINVDGLNSGSTFYYYFRALNANSLIGRAKTCPAGVSVDHLKFAVVSCSNYEGGFFNAYSSIAERNDLDAVIHLGDYIYEYGNGTYGINLPGRVNEPANEILTLADYRTRYSLYRLDEALIRLHQQHTFINIWDDHESANDSYVEGAENHQASEGLWETRKAISKQVYFEWMPIRDNTDNSIYKKISYGNLCDLLMLDTRLEGREEPPASFDTPDVPARTIISPTQFNWLINNLKESNAKWKVIGNQVLFSTFNVGFAAGFGDGMPDLTNLDSIRAVENLFIDNWESYPTQRNSIIDTLRTNDIDNVVFITGDSHCSWAFDVTKDAVLYPLATAFNIPQPNPYNAATGQGYTPDTGEGSWAVEFGTPSISSPNFDESIGAAATAQFEFLMNNPVPGIGAVYNPHLKYVDLDRHGYFILDIKNEAVQADFYYVPTVSQDTTSEAFGQASFTADQQNHLQLSNTPTAPKSIQDDPAPDMPLDFPSSAGAVTSSVSIFSCYPNPAIDVVYLQFGLHKKTTAKVSVYDITGKKVMQAKDQEEYSAGIYKMTLDLRGLTTGTYLIALENGNGSLASQKIVIKK
ncbi:MAG: alkaline phosphatase D family protein [Saprospiraceae bacterium]